ncbi:hypothetical protein LJB99_06110, partial [Deltaproteobacteria bacterium OttesenSCG-928-K17]|nr:hypothetical protein [Deltaproteobacteria bacterium OttesenSCG-928-K17]
MGVNRAGFGIDIGQVLANRIMEGQFDQLKGRGKIQTALYYVLRYNLISMLLAAVFYGYTHYRLIVPGLKVCRKAFGEAHYAAMCLNLEYGWAAPTQNRWWLALSLMIALTVLITHILWLRKFNFNVEAAFAGIDPEQRETGLLDASFGLVFIFCPLAFMFKISWDPDLMKFQPIQTALLVLVAAPALAGAFSLVFQAIFFKKMVRM